MGLLLAMHPCLMSGTKTDRRKLMESDGERSVFRTHFLHGIFIKKSIGFK
jgi:hypothetical protein